MLNTDDYFYFDCYINGNNAWDAAVTFPDWYEKTSACFYGDYAFTTRYACKTYAIELSLLSGALPGEL